MADEYGKPPHHRDVGIPTAYDWQSLRTKRGAELESHYVTLLRELGTRRGMLGQIFTKAQNKIQDPAKLYRLVDMVDDTAWVTLRADVKGDIYEGLLEKNAEDTKSGAGQYFTPRALIRRANIHHTLKKKPMRYEHLADFMKCYNPRNRHERTPTWDDNEATDGRWRSYAYDEIVARDKTSLDIFWLKDKSLTDLEDLPAPEDLAGEIIENLEAGLQSFRKVLEGLGTR